MPPPPLYVWKRTGVPTDEEGDQPTHVLSLEELPANVETPVATTPRGRFVTLGDAIDHSPDAREALLSLSPDPELDRFRQLPFRLLMMGAPISWGMFVLDEWLRQAAFVEDANHIVKSDAFKAAKEDPNTATDTKLREQKIERMVTMRSAYVGFEAAILLAGCAIIFAGLRRWRPVVVALGFGSALWWLFQAGRPSHCFGFSSRREYLLAILGVAGGVTALVLAPSETSVIARLRARTKLPPSLDKKERYRDFVATLGAMAAGLLLPAIDALLSAMRIGTFLRVFVFVTFCTGCFLAFLSYRTEKSRLAPQFVAIAAAALLGFGLLGAADVGVRASFATVLEAQTCIAPDKVTSLNTVQEQSSKETTGARRDAQSNVLAFFVAVCAAPLSEEMLYRGALQRVARRALGGRWAILLSGLIFGLAHMGAFHSAFYMHIGLGLAFASIFEIAGGTAVAVLASAATHVMWNLWLSTMPVF